MSPKHSGRRRFLKSSAALAGMVVGAKLPAGAQQPYKPAVFNGVGVRPLGEISRFEKKVRQGFAGSSGTSLTPLQDLHGIITPADLHFFMEHEFGSLPDIDPAQHRLMIYGLVERPLIFTMAELKRLPSVSKIYCIECNANSNNVFDKNVKTVQETHGRTSCSEWTGVELSLLLQEAGMKKEASWLVAQAADLMHHTASVPLPRALEDGLVAYAQNGEALRLDQGYPLRLIMPGYGGRILAKWLSRIKVVDQPYMTKQDYSAHLEFSPAGVGAFLVAGDKAVNYHFELHAKSVITFPSGEQRLPGPGFYEITGLAWSGAGAVRRVEVSTDGGRSWNDAKLQEPVLRFAHTRFRFPWKWNGEEAILQSRSTDERGDTQPTVSEVSRLWGSDSSEACASVMGELCSRIPRRARYALIQSWKLNRDGSVVNAMPLLGRGPQASGESGGGEHEHGG